MCEGEFESLSAMHATSPGFVPKPYSWGKYRKTNPGGPQTYFLLTEFKYVGEQVCKKET
jgi:protein-ribulosamine 3-kinase